MNTGLRITAAHSHLGPWMVGAGVVLVAALAVADWMTRR